MMIAFKYQIDKHRNTILLLRCKLFQKARRVALYRKT